jgi:hypothetical protein
MRGKLAVLFIVSAVTIFWPGAATAVTCKSSPERDARHWVYRTIDGRRCWFAESTRVVDKAELHWPRDTKKPPENKRPHPTPRELDEVDILLHSYWPPLPKATDGSRLN